jgi:uncharacterized protein involved in exopolysaccharide biosynthesis
MSETADLHRGDLSLVAAGRFLARNWKTVSLFLVLFTAAATALAFMLTPKYRSEVVAAPADNTNALGGLGGQLGGIASLAGITLGSGDKKHDEALEYLRSRIFTAEFIQRHDLMPILFAKRWDAARKQWRDPSDAPTLAEGVGRFSKKVREISEDKRTGIVTVSVVWRDRFLAAQWANWLVAEADHALRERAVAEQTRSVEYLQAEAAHTTTVEIGNAISKLMETELKNAMLARTRDAYAFKVIDPATPSDPKNEDSPNRPMIIVLGAAFGFGIGVIVAAIRQRRPSPA